MSCIGLFITGPLMHVWYPLLYKVPSMIPKIVLDQVVFAPVIVSGKKLFKVWM